MTPQEIYFWTTLPKIGAHLMTSAVLLYVFAALIGGPGTMDASAETTKRFRRIAIICTIVASVFAWGFTLLPDERQIKQIIKGELK